MIEQEEDQNKLVLESVETHLRIILETYKFEFNTEQTRNEIIDKIEKYLHFLKEWNIVKEADVVLSPDNDDMKNKVLFDFTIVTNDDKKYHNSTTAFNTKSL